MANNGSDKEGRKVAGYDFTVEAFGGIDKIDISSWKKVSSRFENADPKFVAEVRKGFLDLRGLEAQEKDLANRQKVAEIKKDKVQAEKVDRQIQHNKTMVASKSREIKIAKVAGHRGESFDRVNKHSQSGKGRTDIETKGNIVESTVGKNKKKTRQLKDHGKKGEAEGKNVNLDAPNMKKDGLQHGKRHGAQPATSDRELARNLSQNEKIDPQKVKAAQERNAAKKQELAEKAAQDKTKAHATDKSKEARQEITAKIDKLRGRKIAADLSGDRQKKIDAKKANTEEVKQLRAAQHEKIRAQKTEQKARQEQKQGEQQGHKAKQDYDRSKGQESKVTHKYDAARFKEVEQRAYDKAKERGADDAAAKKAGEDRVKHVKTKMELNAERQELKDKGQKLSIKDSRPYFEREMKFREGRQRDLADQAKREDRPYQGPPAKAHDFRQMEMSMDEKAFRHRTRLDGRLNDRQITPAEHKDLSQTLERQITEFRQNDLARYHEQTQQNSYGYSQNASQSSGHGMRR